MIFAICFICNLDNNLNTVNLANYVFNTWVLSFAGCGFYFYRAQIEEFNIIGNNKFNPIFVIFNILLIFIPFFILNSNTEKYSKIVENYLSLLLRLSDSNPFLNYMLSVNGTDIDPTTSNIFFCEGTNKVEIIRITKITEIDEIFIFCWIKEYSENNTLCDLTLYNKFFKGSKVQFNIEPRIFDCLNENVEIIIKSKIEKEKIIPLLEEIYQVKLETQSNLYSLSDKYEVKISKHAEKVLTQDLNIEAFHKLFIENLNLRKESYDNIEKNKILAIEKSKILQLVQEAQTKKNSSNLFKIYIESLKQKTNFENFLKGNQSSGSESGSGSESVSSSRTASPRISFLDLDLEEDQYDDLFYKSKKATKSVESVASVKTITQDSENKSIKPKS